MIYTIDIHKTGYKLGEVTALSKKGVPEIFRSKDEAINVAQDVLESFLSTSESKRVEIQVDVVAWDVEDLFDLDDEEFDEAIDRSEVVHSLEA